MYVIRIDSASLAGRNVKYRVAAIFPERFQCFTVALK
jgi:hypothetical protein